MSATAIIATVACIILAPINLWLSVSHIADRAPAWGAVNALAFIWCVGWIAYFVSTAT